LYVEKAYKLLYNNIHMGMYLESTVILRYRWRVVDSRLGHLKKTRKQLNADEKLAFAA